MASPGRRSARHLTDEIRADGSRFRFFQAVRVLALSAAKAGSKAAIPATLRFGSPLSLAFQASEIAAVEARSAKARAPREDETAAQSAVTPPATTQNDVLEMTVGFMGMTGPAGVLPVAYTELLIDRRNQFRDSTGHQFLDLFTHRAVSLFYQAWRKHRFYLPYEAGNADGFSRNLLDIVGVGLSNLQQRLEATGGGIPDRFLTHYAGLLSQKPVSAANIAALVRGYFAVDAELEQFVGQWMHLPPHEQSALDGRPCCLGQNTFVGERLWDRQTKVRIKLGPLSRAQFSQFMPGQPGLAALRELIQFCVGFTLDCDVALILKREEIPAPVLEDTPTAPPRLGYNLWLNSLPVSQDADDVRFALLGNDDRQ
jgi:type VI secretion system protein ImpH